MKLIIATGIFPPDIGGPATYSKKIMEEFLKHGWDVKVLTYANLRECERESTRTEGTAAEESFKVIRVSNAHNVFARYFLYTWNLYKLAKWADLIYAQGPVSEGLPAYIASKLAGKKFVLKVVGDPAWERFLAIKRENKNLEIEKSKNLEFGKFVDLEKFQDMNDVPFKIRILKLIERMVANNADRIITPSKYLKSIVMGWGVDLGKIDVVYNAADEIDDQKVKLEEGQEEIINCPSAKILAQAGKLEIGNLRLDGDIILSAGRIVQWKGFDLLVDIMPELLAVNPKFKLVIVGDGPGMASLKSKVKSQKLCENGIISLTGKLEHKELLDLMKKSKVFILNSGYEGLSHVIIEAMQKGLPCAVSNKGGNPELVEDNKTGLLFEYNNMDEIKNAIIRLWRDDNLRERVVSGSYEKIKKFNYERMIIEIEKILN
ncbi:MAG: glycosyltransferase family 4 protein [bacterium]